MRITNLLSNLHFRPSTCRRGRGGLLIRNERAMILWGGRKHAKMRWDNFRPHLGHVGWPLLWGAKRIRNTTKYKDVGAATMRWSYFNPHLGHVSCASYGVPNSYEHTQKYQHVGAAKMRWRTLPPHFGHVSCDSYGLPNSYDQNEI